MNDQFGINIKQFCAAHEARIREALAQRRTDEALLSLHLEKLRWLQHERLCHLIVVLLTVVAELFAADLTLLHPEVSFGAAIAMLCLSVLLGFYFAHYFFLENTTQRWYRLSEALMEATRPTDSPPVPQ